MTTPRASLITLRPHQAELLDRLRSAQSNRILIKSSVGIGLTTVLIQLAAERAATSSSVVVVTPHRLLVEQWVDRLQAVGTASRPLYTESDFFSLLPSDVPSEGLQEGVTIFSCSILRRPMPRTAIGGSDIDLLIFDDVAASANSRLAETFSELIKRAKGP